MGRHPIFDHPMTNAERQRRHRGKVPYVRPTTKEGDGEHAMRQRIEAELRQRIEAELRQQLEAEFAARASPEAALPRSAKQKLETTIRHATRRLEAQFEQRLRAEVRRRLDEIVLPSYHRTLAEAEAVIKARKGVMKRDLYRRILACLHPDRVDAELKPRYAEAFDAFRQMELALISEKEMPTTSRASDVPRTYDEWMAKRKRPAS